MLVLTRRVGDVVAIGDNIKVIVVSINGKQVRLGIEADRTTTIHREEIYQKIKKETRPDGVGVSLSDTTAFAHEPDVATPEKRSVIVRRNSLGKVTDAN